MFINHCAILLYYEVNCIIVYTMYLESKPGQQNITTIKHNVTPKYWFYFLFVKKRNTFYFPPCINCLTKS